MTFFARMLHGLHGSVTFTRAGTTFTRSQNENSATNDSLELRVRYAGPEAGISDALDFSRRDMLQDGGSPHPVRSGHGLCRHRHASLSQSGCRVPVRLAGRMVDARVESGRRRQVGLSASHAKILHADGRQSAVDVHGPHGCVLRGRSGAPRCEYASFTGRIHSEPQRAGHDARLGSAAQAFERRTIEAPVNPPLSRPKTGGGLLTFGASSHHFFLTGRRPVFFTLNRGLAAGVSWTASARRPLAINLERDNESVKQGHASFADEERRPNIKHRRRPAGCRRLICKRHRGGSLAVSGVIARVVRLALAPFFSTAFPQGSRVGLFRDVRPGAAFFIPETTK